MPYDPNDPYDPRNLGVAAGTSREPLQLGLTDKGAKDFKEGMGSMEKTARMGGFLSFYGLMMKIIEATPLFEILGGFLEIVAGLVTKVVDWEDLVGILKELVDVVAEVIEAISYWIDKLKEVRDVFKEVNPYWQEIHDFLNAIPDFLAWLFGLNATGELERAGGWWEDRMTKQIALQSRLSLSMDAFNLKLANFSNILANFRFPTYFGGGGGGGGGFDPYNPLDLLDIPGL